MDEIALRVDDQPAQTSAQVISVDLAAFAAPAAYLLQAASPASEALLFFLRHLRNLEMSHVEIAPKANDGRPSFVLEDVTRADFISITALAKPPAFLLRAAKDAAFESATNKLLKILERSRLVLHST